MGADSQAARAAIAAVQRDTNSHHGAEPGRPRRLLSLGEVKWGAVMDGGHARRLARARDLLSSTYDTAGCVLGCYSGAGFTDDLRSASDPRLALITLNDIYGAVKLR